MCKTKGEGTDMSGLKMKYFVLNPDSKDKDSPFAVASRRAMRAFADEIESTNSNLAYELRLWCNGIELRGTGVFPD